MIFGVSKTVGKQDFPGSPVVRNMLCDAGDPGQGTKILHATRQLSPNALEPVCLN